MWGVCPQTGQVCSYSLILCALFCVVCLGPCLSAVHALACRGSPYTGWLCLCASRVVFLSWYCGLLLSHCCYSVFLVLVAVSFLPWWLGCWRFGPLSPGFPFPPLPPWLSSGFFWSSQYSAGPSLRIYDCICNGPVVIPLAWRVVADWLLSSLRFTATKPSALCGLCPLYHGVGVVYVPLAPALRYSPSSGPESLEHR